MQLGDAVADLHSRRAANALNGPLPDRNDGKRSLSQRHHDGPRLAARTLLDEYQLTAVEIDSRPIEQKYGLKREMDLSIQILMQAVGVAWPVAQQQRGRARLAGGGAARRHGLVTFTDQHDPHFCGRSR